MIGRKIAAAGMTLGLSLAAIPSVEARAEVPEFGQPQSTELTGLTDEKLIAALETKKQAFERDLKDGKARAEVLLGVCTVMGSADTDGLIRPQLVVQPVQFTVGAKEKSASLAGGINTVTGEMMYTAPVVTESTLDGTITARTFGSEDLAGYDIWYSNPREVTVTLKRDGKSRIRILPTQQLAVTSLTYGEQGVDLRKWTDAIISADICLAGLQMYLGNERPLPPQNI